MARRTSISGAVFVVLLMVSAGCEAPAASDDAGGADAGSVDGAVALDGAPAIDGGPAPDGAAPGVDGGGPSGPRMEVRVDRPIVERDNEQLIELTVRCVPRDEAGYELPDPGDLVVTTSAADASEVRPGVLTFPTRGSYVATCRSASLDLEGSERFEVAFEGIDRDVIRLAASSAAAHDALSRAIEAARAGDEAAVRTVATELTATADAIDLARYADETVLVPFPGGWPTAEEARGAGLGDGADDAAWAPAIAEVADAIEAVRTARAALPTTGELAADAAAPMSAATRRLEAATAQLEALSPSPAAMLESMAALDLLVSDGLPATVDEGAAYFGTVLATATVPPPEATGLTLVEALVTIAIEEIVGEYSYSAILKKVGRVIVDNMIALALAALIDELFPPTLGAPVIDSAHGSAAGFVYPGNPWTALGSEWTSSDPADYVVIFIHPNIPGLIGDIGALFASASGVLDGDHWIQIAKNIVDIIESIADIAATAYDVTQDERLFLVPDTISDDGFGGQFVEFPALPTGVNCSSFPRIGTFIPVRYGVGRGPSHMVNVIQESCP